jgi:hypothetical protein
MDHRPRFSLKFIFAEIFWIALILSLFRLFPAVTPSRLIPVLGLDQQFAGYVLLAPALLLALIMTAVGAGFGNALGAAKSGAIVGGATGLAMVSIFLFALIWLNG